MTVSTVSTVTVSTVSSVTVSTVSSVTVFTVSSVTVSTVSSPLFYNFYSIPLNHRTVGLLAIHVSMGRMSNDTRSRVIFMWRSGLPVSKIKKKLGEIGADVSRKSIYLLLKKYKESGSLADRRKQPRRACLSNEHYEFIDETIEGNRDLTSRQLLTLVKDQFPGLKVSIATIKRVRKTLGWSAKKTRYCAMITEVNKEKRMTWCLDRIAEADLEMDDVIWSDESTIQMDPHRKVTYQKKGRRLVYAARPKHPLSVHVWGGISSRGATSIVIFTGILIATRYTRILEAALVPFLSMYYPDKHRFQQDNDPKHTSKWAKEYFKNKKINWWRTPPASPDLNPIENVWGAMKRYLWDYVKPRSIQELKDGIKKFWLTLTPQRCQKYIHHLKKVIPKVIEEDGGPSGF